MGANPQLYSQWLDILHQEGNIKQIMQNVLAFAVISRSVNGLPASPISIVFIDVYWQQIFFQDMKSQMYLYGMNDL